MMNGRSIFILALAVVDRSGRHDSHAAVALWRQVEAGRRHPGSSGRGSRFQGRGSNQARHDRLARMAKSAVPADAFSSFKDVEDRWVKTTMLEGDVLVEKKLGPKGTPPGLVANIPKGMRAFAIDVTEQSGVSGFILPGHHVDVVRHDHSRRTSLAPRRSCRTCSFWRPARCLRDPMNARSNRGR